MGKMGSLLGQGRRSRKIGAGNYMIYSCGNKCGAMAYLKFEYVRFWRHLMGSGNLKEDLIGYGQQ